MRGAGHPSRRRRRRGRSSGRPRGICSVAGARFVLTSASTTVTADGAGRGSWSAERPLPSRQSAQHDGDDTREPLVNQPPATITRPAATTFVTTRSSVSRRTAPGRTRSCHAHRGRSWRNLPGRRLAAGVVHGRRLLDTYAVWCQSSGRTLLRKGPRGRGRNGRRSGVLRPVERAGVEQHTDVLGHPDQRRWRPGRPRVGPPQPRPGREPHQGPQGHRSGPAPVRRLGRQPGLVRTRLADRRRTGATIQLVEASHPAAAAFFLAPIVQ